MNGYRIQIKMCGQWKWGLIEYETFDEAEKRVEELKKSGVMARVRRSSELFEDGDAYAKKIIE